MHRQQRVAPVDRPKPQLAVCREDLLHFDEPATHDARDQVASPSPVHEMGVHLRAWSELLKLCSFCVLVTRLPALDLRLFTRSVTRLHQGCTDLFAVIADIK